MTVADERDAVELDRFRFQSLTGERIGCHQTFSVPADILRPTTAISEVARSRAASLPSPVHSVPPGAFTS
ncbi:hypothetical protein [Mycobacterium sp. GA-1841]|uniref:hypothetical protein n=1 Tax=Mycobacterium sp. GA-1841 TaxID=1834154 RepID=UPI0015883D17|nr:hypothetical protein [Mycobacterium sp. GA-1841]